MDRLYLFPTDQIEYEETCEEIRELYSVSQAKVEQAIEHAKMRIISSRDNG